jgi:hypothetical protein
VVTATERIERKGVTAYPYGTHRLVSPHGKTRYELRSAVVRLDAYGGRTVRVTGSAVPGYPVEGGPQYRDVTRVPDVRATGAHSDPNLFTFRGRGVEVSYATSSFSGQPLLTYKDARQSRSFGGPQIRTLATEIGSLVSVTLEQVPDHHTLTLTLVVPEVHLAGRAVAVTSQAILTTQRTSIGGPRLITGAVQTYRVIALQGTARFVQF